MVDSRSELSRCSGEFGEFRAPEFQCENVLQDRDGDSGDARHVDQRTGVEVDLPARLNEARVRIGRTKTEEAPFAGRETHVSGGCLDRGILTEVDGAPRDVHLGTQGEFRPDDLFVAGEFRKDARHAARAEADDPGLLREEGRTRGGFEGL